MRVGRLAFLILVLGRYVTDSRDVQWLPAAHITNWRTMTKVRLVSIQRFWSSDDFRAGVHIIGFAIFALTAEDVRLGPLVSLLVRTQACWVELRIHFGIP